MTKVDLLKCATIYLQLIQLKCANLDIAYAESEDKVALRIQVLSDLHLEFGFPESKRFIGTLDPEGIDILVLAGDICLEKQIVDVLGTICQRYENSDVVYVHGNHEFYLSNRVAVLAKTHVALAENKNLHWLDASSKVIRGQRFVGAPLWFENSDQNENLEYFMNDFRIIDGFKSWVYDENLRAMNLIRGSVNHDDIVVTHHLPTHLSVAPRFASGDMNRFFVCDMESTIRAQGPKLWIHGHTHDSFDYRIEHSSGQLSTQIICNPRGYFPNDLNPDFNLGKVIEI